MRRVLQPPAGDDAFLDTRRAEENPPESRTEAQRDRDRILYSSAFQRLGGITQVSSPESGYAFHTRLTHSVKVAQVAQRIAQRLKSRAGAGQEGEVGSVVQTLDIDAAEAAGLAHDLGHAPFGHVGEAELKALAVTAELDGFEGNAQSFRILTRLGAAGPVVEETTGLNLTRRVLNGTLKYPWLTNSERPSEREGKWGAYPPDSEAFAWVREGHGDSTERSVEAEIMDWADDVTYAVHDVDDFYRAGLIPLDRLRSDRAELDRFQAYIREKHGQSEAVETAEKLHGDKFGLGIEDPYEGRLDQRATLRAAGGGLIGHYVSAVGIEESEGRAWSRSQTSRSRKLRCSRS